MEKAFKLLREVKSVVISTVADGVPQSRIIDIMHYDQEGIYFITCKTKPFYKQLMKEKKVAITAMDKNYVQSRLVGAVRPMDVAMVQEIFERNPAMKELFPGETSNFVPFQVYKGKGELFDLSGRESKMVRKRFAFGGESVNPSGCRITDACVGCDVCRNVCPFDAISTGQPYEISPEKCDECGLCYEACPVNAIEEPREL